MNRRILKATNYNLFTRCTENRPIDLTKHAKLVASMEKNGFFWFCPIIVSRESDGTLLILEGQHRFTIAESLGLPIYYVIADVEFDIAELNCTAKVWTLADYAHKHASAGRTDYREGIDFAREHRIPIGRAFALLAGTTTFNNVQEEFVAGDYKITDREWAGAVVDLFGKLCDLAPRLRTETFIGACMAVCRIPGFDPARLVKAARRHREKLVSYGTRDGYLNMLESLYNKTRAADVPLRHEALQAMKSRAAVAK
jgi:hypothetical protein